MNILPIDKIFLILKKEQQIKRKILDNIQKTLRDHLLEWRKWDRKRVVVVQKNFSSLHAFLP